MNWPIRAGAAWERAEVERRRTGPPVKTTLKLDLQLTDRERMILAAHLADSATMARRAHENGGYMERVARIVTVLEAITEAAGKPGPAQIPVQLDQEQCRHIRGVLRASQVRAGDIRGLGETIAAIITAWERCTGYSPQQEAAEAARPPRIAADTGGWEPLSA